jgi:hypothetical protein
LISGIDGGEIYVLLACECCTILGRLDAIFRMRDTRALLADLGWLFCVFCDVGFMSDTIGLIDTSVMNDR